MPGKTARSAARQPFGLPKVTAAASGTRLSCQNAGKAQKFAPVPGSYGESRLMPRVVGIDHLVLSVGDFARSKAFYDKLLGFLGFKLKYDYAEMSGWSNGRTLFWIATADAQGRKRKYRKGDIGFHHYAFELASRGDVDKLGAFLDENGMTVIDPPGEYYGYARWHRRLRGF